MASILWTKCEHFMNLNHHFITFLGSTANFVVFYPSGVLQLKHCNILRTTSANIGHLCCWIHWTTSNSIIVCNFCKVAWTPVITTCSFFFLWRVNQECDVKVTSCPSCSWKVTEFFHELHHLTLAIYEIVPQSCVCVCIFTPTLPTSIPLKAISELLLLTLLFCG